MPAARWTTGGRSGRAEAPELAAVLRVAEPEQREARVSEELRDDPAAGEEGERLPQRRGDAGEPHRQEKQPELEQSQRRCEPARLIRQQPVICLHV
jgi:hypothetical protein